MKTRDLKVWNGSAEVCADGGAQPAVVVVGGDVYLVEQTTFDFVELTPLKSNISIGAICGTQGKRSF